MKRIYRALFFNAAVLVSVSSFTACAFLEQKLFDSPSSEDKSVELFEHPDDNPVALIYRTQASLRKQVEKRPPEIYLNDKKIGKLTESSYHRVKLTVEKNKITLATANGAGKVTHRKFNLKSVAGTTYFLQLKNLGGQYTLVERSPRQARKSLAQMGFFKD